MFFFHFEFKICRWEEDTCDDADGKVPGWQVAYRGIQLALNNDVEEGQKLLRGDQSCIHRQAGYCYLTFIVSRYI